MTSLGSNLAFFSDHNGTTVRVNSLFRKETQSNMAVLMGHEEWNLLFLYDVSKLVYFMGYKQQSGVIRPASQLYGQLLCQLNTS